MAKAEFVALAASGDFHAVKEVRILGPSLSMLLLLLILMPPLALATISLSIILSLLL